MNSNGYLDNIIEQVIKSYGWTHQYACQVADEYSKFLYLRNVNSKLSPSNDIDKFWHQHILNTQHYVQYCLDNFGKFIHHDPEDANDQDARSKRLMDTINEYIRKYGRKPPRNIWPISYERDQPKVAFNMLSNMSSNTSLDHFIHLKIVYTFDTYNEEGKFGRKKPRKNSGYKYDGKIRKLSRKGTIGDLKDVLSKVTGHNKLAILFYKNHEVNNYYGPMRNDLSEDTRLDTLPNNGLTAILEEMTSNGYC